MLCPLSYRGVIQIISKSRIKPFYTTTDTKVHKGELIYSSTQLATISNRPRRGKLHNEDREVLSSFAKKAEFLGVLRGFAAKKTDELGDISK